MTEEKFSGPDTMLGYLIEHDVMATFLFENNNSLGIELSLYKNTFLVFLSAAADDMSQNQE